MGFITGILREEVVGVRSVGSVVIAAGDIVTNDPVAGFSLVEINDGLNIPSPRK